MAPGELMDVVYPYKAAAGDFELRYSMRSLRNMPHGRVIVAGDRPGIANDRVTFIPVETDSDRFRSSTANLLAAADEASTDQIVTMNDDFFILKPWRWRHENRGTIDEYLMTGGCAGRYRQRIQSTKEILKEMGVAEPLWFGLHTPTVYNRRKLIDLIRDFDGEQYLLRTLYHNLHPAPSTRRQDVKIYRWSPPSIGQDILSISDEAAKDPACKAWLQAAFPDPSPYEYGGRCLILGHGPTVWQDLADQWGDFGAVIASPEAAEHWPGPVLAVANDDKHALMIAESYGFEDLALCGQQQEVKQCSFKMRSA